MKFRKAEIARYEAFSKQFPEEVESHGSVGAALGCLGFTFYDEIERLQEWLTLNRPDISIT